MAVLAVAMVLFCPDIGFGQDSRFQTPEIERLETLGELSLGGVGSTDETEGLEDIQGEVVPGTAATSGSRVPDFSRYGPVGRNQPGSSSGDQTPLLDPPQEETLSQSQALPNQYQGEFIYPDWLGDKSDSGSSSSRRPGAQQRQPEKTVLPKLTAPRLRIDGMKAIQNANREFDSSSHEIVRERYPDGQVKIVRTIAQDSEGNYYNDGGWLMYDRQQRPIASGTYVRGSMEGDWERVHESGSEGLFSQMPFNLFNGPYLSRANFVRNEIDGVWSITDKAGKLIFSITFENGVRNGIASWYYPTGKKMRETTFKEGVPHGFVLQWDQQGKLQRREQFVDGRRVIRKKSAFSNQQLASERVFRDRKLVPQGSDNWWAAKPATFARDGEEIQYGPVTEWFPNRQPKMTGRYVDGKRDGLFTWWHQSHNKKAEGNFSRGQRIGLWRYWHESGMKRSEGRFENDKPIGLWRSWDSGGKVIDEEYFSLDQSDQSEDDMPSDTASVLENSDSPDSNSSTDEEISNDDPFNEDVNEEGTSFDNDPGGLGSYLDG